jgi:16S rRNA (cytosine1402-N4)-methyltransferase
MNETNHQPVMLTQAVDGLSVKTGEWYLDATFGQGGHTQEILNRGGKVLATDWDQAAVEAGKTRFATELKAGQLLIARENFTRIAELVESSLDAQTANSIQGILFDFGTSTQQLKSSERGFSFDGDGPLDMRMDDRLGVQAKDLLALVPPKQLAQLFFDFGGEKEARKIAQAIKRSPTPITTVESLNRLIVAIKGQRQGKLHPATKVFQSLRIAVNSELDNIQQALPSALKTLAKGGRLVTIAFHEGEDRIVKNSFREWEEQQLGQRITKKALIPSAVELRDNPRARSAKLRIFEKL